MKKSLMAVVFAAACAAVSVGIIPPPVPAAAAVQNSKHDLPATGKSEMPAPRAAEHRTGCVEAWPYYEASCLRDMRVHNGVSTAVRVVTADKQAGSASKPRSAR
jgi:hypothetical protein